jgi:hypothetical protein
MPDRRLPIRIPWRLRQYLKADYYIRRVTQASFRAILETPPMPAPPESSVEVLTLLDRSNVVNYLIGIKSLLMHSPRPLAVTVVSDGSLVASDNSLLSQHVDGIRIIHDLPEAGKAVSKALGVDERKAFPLLRKLVDLPLGSRSPYLLFFDSDIIFRRPIPGSFFNLNGSAVRYNKDHDHSRHDPLFHYVLEFLAADGKKGTAVTNVNSGLMLWERSRLVDCDLLGYTRFVKERHGSLYHLIEQDSFNVFASRVPSTSMPIEYLVLCNWDDVNAETRRSATSVHYVGGERYKTGDYRNDGLAVLKQLRRKGV